jgi:hypothetical protein
MTRVDLDVVPGIARPPAVEKVLGESLDLRDRYRRAQEDLAKLEAELHRLEDEDVAQAAERVRAGSAPGNLLTGIAKAKQAAELAKRNGAAIGLANDVAQNDLAAALNAAGAEWLASLDEEAELARQRGRKALAAVETAMNELAAATSASAWVASGLADDRWDRRVSPTRIGTYAASSARATANGSPLDRATLLAYMSELLEPPAPAPVAIVEPATSNAVA